MGVILGESIALFRHSMFFFLVLCGPSDCRISPASGRMSAKCLVAEGLRPRRSAQIPRRRRLWYAAAGQHVWRSEPGARGHESDAGGRYGRGDPVRRDRGLDSRPLAAGDGGLPDADQQGYRVPLVTGMRDDDLAGSLTYYFNKQQRCRRITFQGTTGDARRLIALVTKRFGFVQHATDDPSLLVYQSRWNGRAISEVHIRPARVVRSSDPQSRFEVLLALNDPDAG